MPEPIQWLIKKRGFVETLLIIDSFGGECSQRDFHQHLHAHQSYYNAHLRVRDEMQKAGLIGFKLNQANQKVICLTDAGRRAVALYKQLAELVNGPPAAGAAP